MYENTIHLIGFVGQVDVYQDEAKKPFAKLMLATNQTFLNKEGDRVTKTAWHTLHCFGNLVNAIKDKVKKGSYLSVSGELEYDEWPPQENRKVAVIKVNKLYHLINPKLQRQLSEVTGD